MTQPEPDIRGDGWIADLKVYPKTIVLPDADREEMLEAAGMTTGHRWEDRYVDAVGTDEDED